VDDKVKAFENYLTEGSRTAFPNPSRLGCPSREFLRNLARRKVPIEETVACADHLRSCSECFLDYSRFLDDISKKKRDLRVIALGSVAAALCIVLLGEFIVSRRSASNGQSNAASHENTIKGGAQTEIVAALHLEDQIVIRGDGGQGSSDRIPALKRGLLRLSIYLPLDSAPGTYTMQLLPRLTDKQGLLTFSGAAEMKGGHLVLDTSADFSNVQPGKYYLAIRHDNSSWRYYQIALS
jgi:hypothetical protein